VSLPTAILALVRGSLLASRERGPADRSWGARWHRVRHADSWPSGL